MNEQQQLIKDTLNRVLTDLCDPHVVDRSESGEWAASLWDTLTETGLTAAGIPEAAGGSGGDIEDSLLVIKEAARFAAPVPLAEHFIAGMLLSQCGGVISPEPHTVGVGDFSLDESFMLTGSASGVAFGRWAKFMVVVARHPQGDKLCRVSISECSVDEYPSVAGEPRDDVTVSMTLDAADVFDAGEDLDSKILHLGAATRCGMMAGALESVLELSVQYSMDRTQFGRPISKFQAIQQQLAVMAGEVAAAQMAGHAAAAAVASGEELDIAIGKARVGEAVSACTDIAHQVHGAMGYTMEHSLNHRTRRLWCWREEYGNERVWQQIVGKAFINGGADQLWDHVTSRR
ncbi:MAG: acyl-CoA dehydrogenase [Candidatus Azotimanducaceae bacterium]|jgi:acyl-CoA dehydrogenase